MSIVVLRVESAALSCALPRVLKYGDFYQDWKDLTLPEDGG